MAEISDFTEKVYRFTAQSCDNSVKNTAGGRHHDLHHAYKNDYRNKMGGIQDVLHEFFEP